MENVWEILKSMKGRSWIETKEVLNQIVKDIPQVDEVVISYNVNSETLHADDKVIYGVFPKSEPFYLERCKLCSGLFKPSVLNHHYDSHHKRNISNVKETSFVSPGRKKLSKKGTKSTSEDDSESVISSEAPSPVVDLQETQSNDSNTGTTGDDSTIDIILVDEIPSEESKPPTPGPQDFYEEFAVPYTEEIQVLSSVAETGGNTKLTNSNSKSALKLKISASKDFNVKNSSSTSLLEAHLLANTKYNTTGNLNSDIKFHSLNYKNGSTFVKNDGKIIGKDQISLKSEDFVDVNDLWKTSFNQVQMVTGSPKLKTEAKISIPISALPQNAKIIGSLKKTTTSVPLQFITAGQNSVSNLDSAENCGSQSSSSPFDDETHASPVEVSLLNLVKEKSTKSKRNRRSKAKNRSTKNVEFDADKHCGVLINKIRQCTRSLTCKTHAIASRRAVEGRSKEFDQLLADHRAFKEALKEQEKSQSVSLSEPPVSLPILAGDNVSGNPNPITLTSTGNDSDILKIRVPNANSNSEIPPPNSNYGKPWDESRLLKIEPEAGSTKTLFNFKTSVGTGIKPLNVISNVFPNSSSANDEVKPQIYDRDIKISFVCSDMLYKVGGLLYLDRSRQAIRQCMEPMMAHPKSRNPTHKPAPPSVNKQKITDFLQLVKNYGAPPKKLRLFQEKKTDANVLGVASGAKNVTGSRGQELGRKASDEVERMKAVLRSSSQILNTVAADEDEMAKFRMLTRRKRKMDGHRLIGGKKIKQESISDENYDINTLFSFDKCITKDEDAMAVGHDQYSVIAPSDGYAQHRSFGGGMSNVVTFGNELKNGGARQQVAVAETPSCRIPTMMDGMSYNVYLNQPETGSPMEAAPASGYVQSETVQLLQRYEDLETEIRNTVGSSNIQELYQSQPTLSNGGLNTAASYLNYVDANGDAATAQNSFEPANGGCENVYKMQDQQPATDNHMSSIEETISKNYSLLEEYCKDIPTDEFFLGNKGDLEYYEAVGGDGETMNNSVNNMKVNDVKNEAIVVDNSMYAPAQERVSAAAEVATRSNGVDGLSFDSQVLNSYLSSLSTETSNQNANEMNFVGSRQYNISSVDQTVSKDRIYEKILTLNKQFQDSTAVNIEKLPTNPSSVVYAEPDNDEVLKWLF